IPTGNVTILLNGTEITNITLDGEGNFSYSISGLNAGFYNITVRYNGDSNYTESSTNLTDIIVNQGNPTVNVVINSDIISFGENVTITGNVTGLDVVPTGNVTILVNGTEVANKTLTDGKFSYSISDLNAGFYNITVRYNGDSNYTSIENSTDLTVIPKNITILTFINETVYSDNLTGNINTNITNKSGNISVIINGTVYNGTVGSDGLFILNNTDSLNAGHYEYCPVSFISADGNYIAEDDCAFNIIRKNITINATINNITYGDNLSGSVNADFSGRISIYPGDGNFSYEFDTIGPFTTEWEYLLSAGTYEAGIIFLSNNGNYQGYANVSYTINKTNSTVTIDVDDINYGENVTVNGTVIGLEEATIPTGNVTILVNNTEIANVTLICGKFNYSIPNLDIGDYNISVIYNGDNNYNSSECRANVTVKSIPAQGINIAVNTPDCGDDAVVNVTVIGLDGKAVPTGNVTILVNGTEYANRTLSDGKCNCSIPNLNIGDYNITVIYNGDNNYTSIENSTILTVIPKSINMSAVINNATYGDDTISGKVNASMNGTVTIQVVPGSTKPINVTVNESGEFTIPLKLPVGTYSNVSVTFLSSDGNYR
ncbi:MAG: Ig-like domain-containing protein, partial [archaeon]|nr:Ig-like domain-containing protein [archaeon]